MAIKIEKGEIVMKEKSNRYVVVTTEFKGVFYGKLEFYNRKDNCAVLSNARMCVYWSANTKGILGLASIGPQNGSKITPIIPSIELTKVTAVMDCTIQAIDQWDKGIWD